jgi:hypothetical protein
MIKDLIVYVKCKIKGHSFIDAGSCPFTGKDYLACIRCKGTIEK